MRIPASTHPQFLTLKVFQVYYEVLTLIMFTSFMGKANVRRPVQMSVHSRDFFLTLAKKGCASCWSGVELSQRLGNSPSPEKQEKPAMANSNSWDFEIIEANQVTRVSRGRKSNVDPRLIEGLRTLTAGKAVRLPQQALDPKSPDYRKDKARVSASLRSACRSAGHQNFSIEFSPEGVPQITIKK